ncbi:MAG: hypothetical protein A3F72_17990 [Bacteroidetes bacterium RIFCSPLOWO2_12_FULL_35_15]|nr:MAG: hypothetical protein A3F72_17990 [Bacteroidetes bacterium RIFCSPLOWO2_12_FULL_35_15]
MLLKKGEIHLYCVLLNPSTVFFEKCRAALSEKEQERISYFKFPSVQKSFIISQGALRLLLSDYLNIDAPKIQISKHSKGKPFTIDDTDLCFNISNSGGYVVYAFSRAGEVGIDIEKIRTLPDLDELIEKNFSAKEKTFISKNKAEKEKRFFKFWTVKEAYLKAIGEGMRLSPDNLEFTFENNNYELDAIKGVFEQEDWLFTDFSIATDYAGTIVYKDKQTKISEIKFIN